MRNFCINLETGSAFIYKKTLESDYMQGRFGAVPYIPDVDFESQYTYQAMNIEEPKKLISELRKLADKLEAEL